MRTAVMDREPMSGEAGRPVEVRVGGEVFEGRECVEAVHGQRVEGVVFEGPDREGLALLVGGNPCQPMFYAELAGQLFARSQRRWEVRCNGHLGHDGLGRLNGGALYGLDQQLGWHAGYLRRRLESEPGLRVVLVGHSVGAWLVLQMLRGLSPSEAGRVPRAVLLFPTIIQIGQTPNGRAQMRSVWCRWCYAGFAGCLACLPDRLKRRIISSREPHLSEKDVQVAAGFVTFNSVNNAIHMYKDEALQITELDVQTLERWASRVLIYFGTTDDWAPLEHCDEIKRRVPGARVRVDQLGMPHGFAHKFSAEIAELCWEEIAAGLKEESKAVPDATSQKDEPVNQI